MSAKKPPALRSGFRHGEPGLEDRRTLDEVARDHIELVMEACRGNRTNAARTLGIDRKTLAAYLKRWGIVASKEPRVLPPGSIIAFEGIDGAGLTTQARLLVNELNARGHRALYTSEPSAGVIGQFIRQLLGAMSSLAPGGAMRALSLLFAADRIDHFHRVVAPALAANITVVSDRWYHSSLAYQRTGVERDWIMALNRHLRTPDLTIVLDVSVEVGQLRRKQAGRAPEFFHDLATQKAVVGGYRTTIAELRAEGERIEIIDGEAAITTVAASVSRLLGVSGRKVT